MITEREIKRGKKALELVKRIAAIDTPEYASEIDGDLYCFFCGEWVDIDPHAWDCIWLQAKRLVGE